MRIDFATAEALLDLGERIGSKQRGKEQLEGAVALHEMLETHGIAYLADEVGMGKTYVALAVVALFRHFQPKFRVLFLAPRKNIQEKWIKELGNFTRYCVKFPDFRVRSLNEQPNRAVVQCDDLLSLVRETSLDADRDFFMRMTSFSLALGNDRTAWTAFRDKLRRELPWLDDEALALHNKDTFKDNVGRAICCALPEFDLVIVDEAHNLKHGFSENGSARNRVLGLAFGHPSQEAPKRVFPGYGPRAHRVLFLSATPMEDSYRHLYNQLDVFGHAAGFEVLQRASKDEDDTEQEASAKQILIRRVTAIQTKHGDHLTKNLYRRQWREGGVTTHDKPQEIRDVRQRLVVALVQKKVSEVLQHERFGASFQIGMLASFESFAQTAKTIRSETDVTFDDADQTDDREEREGIDVHAVDTLAKKYRDRFGAEMPHPKMDAIVDKLAHSWKTGEKALIFVRRVASVKELKRKLDDRYDQWLIDRFQRELPDEVRERFEDAVAQYRQDKQHARKQNADMPTNVKETDEDSGGVDTFFAWFFRGEGPQGIVSGATIAQRFKQHSGPLATFFERNHLAMLLEVRPEQVLSRLADVLALSVDELRAKIQDGAGYFFRQTKDLERLAQFRAAQGAALVLLKESASKYKTAAEWVLQECYKHRRKEPLKNIPRNVADMLEMPTFFSELLKDNDLRRRLWPTSTNADGRKALRERELRAEYLASTVRLGHSLIDFYVMMIRRLKSLEPRVQDSTEKDSAAQSRIDAFLKRLRTQMETPRNERAFGAFDELAEIAEHFDLILDVNDADARDRALEETAASLKVLLGKQQPVGGMSGQVTPTLIRQFRMPGYPFVLVSTELLQEGEDLHTFCSSIYHYGISWTPSSMEQRIGRIDRVRSQSDRRISQLTRKLEDADKLDVYYPHLQHTVEVLQVRRVLDRMETFLRLMHRGSVHSPSPQRNIHMREMESPHPSKNDPDDSPLVSAYPVPAHIREAGGRNGLAVPPEFAARALERFRNFSHHKFGDLKVEWEERAPTGVLLGTASVGKRIQPFGLYLQSHDEQLMVRCISPVGVVSPKEAKDKIVDGIDTLPVRLGVILDQDASYDLTVEDDVNLVDETHDEARISLLIRRVVERADECEQRHLPNTDEELPTFRRELEKELSRGV